MADLMFLVSQTALRAVASVFCLLAVFLDGAIEKKLTCDFI